MFDNTTFGVNKKLNRPLDEVCDLCVKAKIFMFKEGCGYDFTPEFKEFSKKKTKEYADDCDTMYVFFIRVLKDYGVKFDIEDMSLICCAMMIGKLRRSLKMGWGNHE